MQERTRHWGPTDPASWILSNKVVGLDGNHPPVGVHVRRSKKRNSELTLRGGGGGLSFWNSWKCVPQTISALQTENHPPPPKKRKKRKNPHWPCQTRLIITNHHVLSTVWNVITDKSDCWRSALSNLTASNVSTSEFYKRNIFFSWQKVERLNAQRCPDNAEPSLMKVDHCLWVSGTVIFSWSIFLSGSWQRYLFFLKCHKCGSNLHFHTFRIM